MAAAVVLLLASVLVAQCAHASVPPKFIKASYGIQKALYAKDFGYSLKPIPPQILIQATPPKTLPIVGEHPIISARKGRAYKYYRSLPRSIPRRRRKRPPSKRRRPSSYGVPVYATKYKNYVPSRRPPSSGRYKKRRPYLRGPPRRPPIYREVQPDFDEYEQEIPDDYDDYDTRDGDYSYFDVPSKRLPLEVDKEFLNRHADLYNGGFNPGIPRVRAKDVIGQYTDQVKTRVRYQSNPEEHYKDPDKLIEDSQESLWPGEVTSVHPRDHPWNDNIHAQAQTWSEEVHTASGDSQSHQADQSHGWHTPSRPPREDNQWQVYPQQSQQQTQHEQPHQQQQYQFNWPPRPTRSPELRGWTTSLRPKPLSAAVAVPSRPVAPREQEPSNHHPVYNWDPSSNSYRVVEHGSRPRYQAHYSESDFNNYHHYQHDSLDRKGSTSNGKGSHRSHRAFSEPDIGFGEGMEVVDDGVAGWKVKK